LESVISAGGFAGFLFHTNKSDGLEVVNELPTPTAETEERAFSTYHVTVTSEPIIQTVSAEGLVIGGDQMSLDAK
jgi:hypothetical protein